MAALFGGLVPAVAPPLAEMAGVAVRCRSVAESGRLGRLVLDVFALEAERAAAYPLLPGGEAVLLFAPGRPARLYGPRTAAALLEMEAGAVYYGVRLRCGCPHWLWDGEMTALLNTHRPLEPLLPGADALGDALGGCTSGEERLTLVTGFLAGPTRHSRAHPLLRRALAVAQERGGQLGVAEMAAAAGCTARHLNRLFRRSVGCPAKTYCQLLQLHQSLAAVLEEPAHSLLHVAVGCGYFDQAHMSRHYRRFLGCSANELRRAAERGME